MNMAIEQYCNGKSLERVLTSLEIMIQAQRKVFILLDTLGVAPENSSFLRIVQNGIS